MTTPWLRLRTAAKNATSNFGSRVFRVWGLALPLGTLAVIALAHQLSSRLGAIAISDDDYARVVIAQKWALHPTWDPSGTSWLPFPFWWLGGGLSLTDNSLEAARLFSYLGSALSVIVLYSAARHLGFSRGRAALFSWSFPLLPGVSPLVTATVPEFPTACLSLFAVSTLAQRRMLVRYQGALALLLACASRYEAWALVPVFAGLHLLRGSEVSSRMSSVWLRVVPGALVFLFPLAWVLHGKVHYNDATFFLTRVAAYKAALGSDLRSDWEILAHYPRSFLQHQPELVLLTLPCLWGRLKTQKATKWLPFLLGNLSLFAFLIVGDLRGGAPTHHPERTLLFAFASCLLLVLSSDPPRGWLRLLVPLAFLGGIVLRWLSPTASYASRSDEETMGRLLRGLGTDPSAILATTDYGYFAIQAAAGPGSWEVLDHHDPRQKDASSPLPIPPRVLERAHVTGICQVIMPLCVDFDEGTLLGEAGGLALYRLDESCR